MTSPYPLTPTSELEAVNICLAAIGEAPVNTLSDSGLTEVAQARLRIHTESRNLQLVGWHWNTEKNYTLALNGSGEAVLPANTLKVDTTGESARFDLVQRGQKLYDRENHTFVLTKAPKVEMVIFLPFEELPEAARYYVTIRAARQMAQGVGSDTLVSFTQQDELDALVKLREAENDTADHNMLSGSYDVYRVLDRSSGSDRVVEIGG